MKNYKLRKQKYERRQKTGTVKVTVENEITNNQMEKEQIQIYENNYSKK